MAVAVGVTVFGVDEFALRNRHVYRTGCLVRRSKPRRQVAAGKSRIRSAPRSAVSLLH
jgi:hypothetical protein